jgi:hypothetical protein
MCTQFFKTNSTLLNSIIQNAKDKVIWNAWQTSQFPNVQFTNRWSPAMDSADVLNSIVSNDKFFSEYFCLGSLLLYLLYSVKISKVTNIVQCIDAGMCREFYKTSCIFSSSII